MDNFEKADIITQVALNKNKSNFLPRGEQMVINRTLKDKLVRYLKEMQANPNRPKAMMDIDERMNQMHGQRVKDLYSYRREGNHVVALPDSQIPPELIYGIEHFVPVGVCMGAGEVEQYVDQITRGLATPIRSMIGFLATGMCVFYNLSDYVLGTNLSFSFERGTEIIKEITNDFNVFCLNYSKEIDKATIDFENLSQWIEKVSNGKGINRSRFIDYCKLYASIRKEYQAIAKLRSHSNPPIDGCNSLWIQQLYPVEEPRKLLQQLIKLHNELDQNIINGIGYNKNGDKKRVLLVTPRIMPPFAEIYRLIERSGGLVVLEQTDMGITNIDYNLDELLTIVQNDSGAFENSIRYIMESINTVESSSFVYSDKTDLKRKIEEYAIEAIICFNFRDCPEMDAKINNITEYGSALGIPLKTIQSDYLEMYDKETSLSEEIKDFLNAI